MTSFSNVAEKARAGERLSFDEGVSLFNYPNLPALGALANDVRERLHGDLAFFNVNMHLNATNVCEASCMFCAFARQEEGNPGAYTMSLADAIGRVEASKDKALTEVHVVNGLHPGLPFDYYEELLRGIKRVRPDLHIKGFTAVEIEYFAQKFGMSREEVLSRLVDCGLGSLPGGGAEIFAPSVRQKICADKVDADGWIEIHQIAHRMGLKSNCTMLYGHVESIEERVDHLCRLREAQDQTGGFQCFVPLAFHPANTSMQRLPPPTGCEDLRVYAVSRLMLDNIPHLKAYWSMVGQKTAQVALWFGADDIDGTVEEERIYHMAGARTPQALTRAELVHIVRKAGRTPVERDTLYRVVRVEAEGDVSREAAADHAGPTRRATHLPKLRVVTTEQPT
ncbi:MAG: aminofutalosine synthase MqnE [Deltaproteobacteria bacterium]|nr:aminofutalosine synthase MqnE [Deltaproteobacteria bacterium]